jgi:hypothetical protein
LRQQLQNPSGHVIHCNDLSLSIRRFSAGVNCNAFLSVKGNDYAGPPLLDFQFKDTAT